MSIINIKTNRINKYSMKLRDDLERRGYKVELLMIWTMLQNKDLMKYIDHIILNCDKCILCGSPIPIYVVKKFKEYKKDLIIVGEVTKEIEKYVDKTIDVVDTFRKINKSEKYIKSFESFKVEEPSTMSELLEKLSVVEEEILSSINAEPVNIDSFLNGVVSNDLHQLADMSDFNKLLRIKGLKKGNVENTDDFETFLLSPFRYLMIWEKGKNELVDPDFLFIQTFNSTEQDWNKIRLYKINGNFKNFYDKLSNRTIEIKDNGIKYIYQTSNKNEWELTNQKETERFPRFVRKEDLLNIINNINESSEIMSFIDSIESDKNYNKIIYLYDGQKIVVFFIESYREYNMDDFMELEGMMDIFVTDFSEHDNMVKNLYNIENVQGLKTNNKIENSMLEKVSKFIEKGGNFSDFKLVSFDTI
jgi:sulfur carrier protein ThiS